MTTADLAWPDTLAHRPLLESVADEFGGISAFDRDDLLSEGLIGLRNATICGDDAKSSSVAYLKTSARNAMRRWLAWRDGASRRTGIKRWRGNDTSPPLEEIRVAPPLIDEGLTELLLSAIETELDPRERATVSLFYGIGCERVEPSDIGLSLGIARETVHRVRLRAATKLRSAIEGEPS